MHGIECARLTTSIAEAGQYFERFAVEDVHFLVRSVGKINVLLLRILRERDVPNSAVAKSLLVVELLFNECSIWFEHLDAIVHAVAYIKVPSFEGRRNAPDSGTVEREAHPGS